MELLEIRELNREQDYRFVWPVMWQLRPDLGIDGDAAHADRFVEQVILQRQEGYRLVAAWAGTQVRAVAGFRVQTMLGRGRFLYVDDLVTDAKHRGSGAGRALLHWLVEEAGRQQCGRLHLDSGVYRHGAHAFYFAQGMKIAAYHFDQELKTK